MSFRSAKSSLLQFAETVSVNGLAFWDLVELPDIPVQPDDTQYPVEDGDRLDKLAYKFYGDPVLKWILAGANGLESGLDLPADITLRVPSVRTAQILKATANARGLRR